MRSGRRVACIEKHAQSSYRGHAVRGHPDLPWPRAPVGNGYPPRFKEARYVRLGPACLCFNKWMAQSVQEGIPPDDEDCGETQMHSTPSGSESCLFAPAIVFHEQRHEPRIAVVKEAAFKFLFIESRLAAFPAENTLRIGVAFLLSLPLSACATKYGDMASQVGSMLSG